MQVQPHTLDSSLSIAARAQHLLDQMTLSEKIGQITQVEKNSITPDEVSEFSIGSVLSGGGGNPSPNTPENWARMVRSFQEAALQSRLRIPLIYGSDGVHGHNNVRGAVIFPHNIGLGAARDPELMKRIGQVTSKELYATNVHWTFAPAVSLPQDIRWGRSFEGYSDTTEIVTELSLALLEGFHADPHRVLPSVKHYIADGATTWGTKKPTMWPTQLGGDFQNAALIQNMPPHPEGKWTIDQGTSEIDEAALRAVHLPPYQAAVEAGALNIMVSYSSWGGHKMHAHKYLLTDVLKGELGFKGFIVSDWMALDQIAADYYESVVSSINAGLDMIMVPYNYRRFIEVLTRAVENGDVALSRIDDAVLRILEAKLWLGVFEAPFGDESLLPQVGSPEHRAVAREAVRKSLVLLKNESHILPLSNTLLSLLVAGRGADDVGIQCGGWTVEWQGAAGDITPGTTILEGIRAALSAGTSLTCHPDGDFPAGTRAEVALVVVGELPYSEGEGDRSNLNLSAADAALVEKVRPLCDKLVLLVISGRPIIITDQVALADAVVAAWLPGSEGDGVADVLFGLYPFTGKLPHPWPRTMEQIPRAALLAHPEPPLWDFGYRL
jgi:beta-glucosidase